MKEIPRQDIIIVGAGVLGTVLAVSLAKQARSILLIERDWSEPDRIVGELLQPGGIKALQLLDMDHCLEGIDAIRCLGYGIFNGPEAVRLSYNANKTPTEGRSFHHGKFIQKLREEVKKFENITILEATVTEILEEKGKTVGVVSKTKDQTIQQHFATLTIIVDGCFSKFRKQSINKPVIVKSHFVGFVLRDCELPFVNHGHVVLAKPSPILLYQIGTRDTRILVDIPGKLPTSTNGDLKNYLKDFVGPQLPKSAQKSYYIALETDKPRMMPNSFLAPSANRKEGMLMVGDAMNMRHPLTGGGMTVAFWDAVHITELLAPIKSFSTTSASSEIHSQLLKLHWKRKPLASVVNILAQALYALFSAGDDWKMQELRNACFRYFELGGKCVSTPVGLLSGMIPSPMTLIGHFFAVALYGCYLMLKRNIFLFPIVLLKCVFVLFSAAVVILPVIFSEMVY